MTEEQKLLSETARKFCQTELPAVAKECEETGAPVSRMWMKRYAELGFLGINAAEEHGGLALSHYSALLVLEEFAKISVAAAFPVFEATVGPVRIIERFGSPALKARVLPKVFAGEMMIAISMSEPDAGTALTDLRTRGHIEHDHVVLNGAKRWCSGAGHADGYVVFCRLSDATGAPGIGAVYVDKELRGLSFGKPEQLMGWRGVASADIFLEDCRAPKENILIGPGGFSSLMNIFNLERCGNATMSVGVAAGALEQVLEYVQQRKQFGKRIIQFQAVQIRLAEMAIKVETGRTLVERAVAPSGRNFPQSKDTLIAKCFANEMVREVTTSAMQLMGGYGYTKSYGMEQRVRDSWGWGIAGGTIDIQKINIASALIGERFNQR